MSRPNGIEPTSTYIGMENYVTRDELNVHNQKIFDLIAQQASTAAHMDSLAQSVEKMADTMDTRISLMDKSLQSLIMLSNKTDKVRRFYSHILLTITGGIVATIGTHLAIISYYADKLFN